MEKEHKLAPLEEQDRLHNGYLKTDSGRYIRLDSSVRMIETRKVRLPDSYYADYEEANECFVATAVYGDREAPQVRALRQFRDEVLRKSRIGKAFIDFYYSGAGRKLANLIKDIPSSIPIIRKGLDFLVRKHCKV
jgi:hypothetical protein